MQIFMVISFIKLQLQNDKQLDNGDYLHNCQFTKYIVIIIEDNYCTDAGNL